MQLWPGVGCGVVPDARAAAIGSVGRREQQPGLPTLRAHPTRHATHARRAMHASAEGGGVGVERWRTGATAHQAHAVVALPVS
jgi:hypothetical protein